MPALQLEARAHIAVQAWNRARVAPPPSTAWSRLTGASAKWFPKTCYGRTAGESVLVIPGALRERDVKVGHHVPIPGALPRFLERRPPTPLGRTDRIPPPPPTIACLDSSAATVSGDVPRDAAGASIRACGRSPGSGEPTHACDAAQRPGWERPPERRGLAAFTLDDVHLIDFMDRAAAVCATAGSGHGVLPPIRRYPPDLYRGYGEVAPILAERQARRVTAALKQILTSDGSRASLRLAFPAMLAFCRGCSLTRRRKL